MSRIRTDQIATGRPVFILVPLRQVPNNSPNLYNQFLSLDPLQTNEDLPIARVTLLAANDFSVPAVNEGGIPDPADPNRELRGGEMFIETPLTVSNRSGQDADLQIYIQPDGINPTTFQTHKVPPSTRTYQDLLLADLIVPAGKVIQIPIQGTRIVKYAGATQNGKLLAATTSTDALTVYGVATESEMQNHAPDAEE